MSLLLASTFQHFDFKEYFSDELSLWKVACITTAALMQIDDNPNRPDWVKGEISAVEDSSKEFFEYDLRGKNIDDLKHDLSDCDLIYLIGGNTFCLLDVINKSSFRDFLPEFLGTGKSIWGGSAGACVCCPDIDYIRAMDEPEKSDLKSTVGLGLTDLYIIPHFHTKHHAAALECLKNNPDKKIICLRDEQAIYIDRNSIEIL